MIKRCIGCGSVLQTSDTNKIGYVPMIKADDNTYCQRCFRLKNYSELPKIIASQSDYERVIDNVLEKNGLVVLIVDLFDFSGSFIPKMLDKLRPKNIILVANKYDLLPKSTNPDNIIEWLNYMCNRLFFKTDAIHVVSSMKGYYLDELMQTIDMLRKGRDVYFVGCANVGKSSLINALLKRFTNRTNDLISTSVIPGTTLDAIRIPFFDDNKALVDTPGLINTKGILDKLLPISYKKILPDREIKPITYQIIKENSIFISGLACVSLTEGANVSFTCYFSDKLVIHRTKNERIEELINTQLGKLLTPPSIDELALIEYETNEFQINSTRKQDIVFSGLGFITLNKNCKVRIKAVKGMEVFLRNAIIGN